MKYSDRGATVDVYIEIINEETFLINLATPFTNSVPIHALGDFVTTMKSFDGSVSGVSDSLLKPGDQEALLHQVANTLMESNKSAVPSRNGSMGCSLDMYADAKATSKEMSALFVSSGITSPDHVERTKETSDHLPLSDDPLRRMRTRAMLVVHVVDSGIGLLGILKPCYHHHHHHPHLSYIITCRSSTVVTHQLS